MKTLKIVVNFIFLLVGAVGVSLVTAIIHLKAPFVTLGMLAIITFCFPRNRRDLRRRNMVIAGAFLGFLLLVPGSMFARIFEAGFCDGPFLGRNFSGDIAGLAESESVAYRNGQIVVCNRSDEQSPIMFFKDKQGKVRWAVEMDVSANPEYSQCHLERMENLEIHYGLVRDVVNFKCWWTFGGEAGLAFVWKFNRFQRFYLSW